MKNDMVFVDDSFTIEEHILEEEAVIRLANELEEAIEENDHFDDHFGDYLDSLTNVFQSYDEYKSLDY